jgi:DNA recombination protein RmuC
MDVKFPLDNYLKHLEAETEDESRRCKDRFLQDVKARIKEVTRRDYIDRSDNTIDYVIIFIPNEQIFSFINQNAPMLLDEALQVHVILCSPFTLFGILAIIRQAIDHFYLEERTTQVLEVLAGFRKQWNTFIDSFERLGKKIDAVQDEFAGLTTKKRSQIDRQLSRIEDLRQLEESPLSTGEDVIGEHEHTNKVIYRVGANDQKKKFVSDDTDSDNDISL